MSNYGSGTIGDWLQYTPVLSATPQITSALSTGGAYVFGDSILAANAAALATRLYERTGQTIAVNAWPGRPTAPAVDALETWVTEHGCPAVVVMATGTNDIFTPPVMAAQVARVFDIVDSTTTVVWVNVYAARWVNGWPGRESDQRNSAWVNLQIAQEVASRPNGVVAPWYESLCGNPGYRLSTWLADGVHTSPAGVAAWTSIIVDTIEGAA